MKISVISLEKLSRIVEYDLKAWHSALKIVGSNDESNTGNINTIFAGCIVKHIETGIGQMHREDRNLIYSAIEKMHESCTVDIIVNDRLRTVYINTLRNRLSKLGQLEDVIKEQLDIIGVDYTDDDDED